MDQNPIKIAAPDFEEIDAEAAMVLNESQPGYYQQWMNSQNDRRLAKLEDQQIQMLATLGEIHSNTKDLSTLRKDVDDLKEEKNKILGAKEILVLVGAPALSWISAKLGH